MECFINDPDISLLMKHLVIGQRQTLLIFHWSPPGSLVSIGQHFVTTNIDIEIEADLNTEAEAVWAVHSCNGWF